MKRKCKWSTSLGGKRSGALLATEAFAYQEGLATHAALYSLDAGTFNTAVIDRLLALLSASD